MKYAIGHLSFFDNVLHMELIEAPSLLEAYKQSFDMHFGSAAIADKISPILSDEANIEIIEETAFEMDGAIGGICTE